MLISIIMPAYNASAYVRQAIDSIVNQAYTNWELLIADDGSKDDTRTIVDSYADPRIKSFHNEKNLGYLKTCNKLFSLCSGDLITFQDADDWSSSDRLVKQFKEFQGNSQLGICGTWAAYVNLKDQRIREKKTAVIHEDIVKEMRLHNSFCGASIMITRAVLKDVGGYKEYFNRVGNEDYDWSLRIVERYHSMNIPEFLYFVRVTSNSVSRTIKDPKQLISNQLVHFLADQRKTYNQDSLTGLNINLIERFERELLKPFDEDKALMYRKAADMAAYNQDQRSLLNYSWQALKSSPKDVRNYKYLLSSLLRYRF